MARAKTAKQLWMEYAGHVLPPDAGAVQVIETRKAFYAGMYSMWTAIQESASPEGDIRDGVRGLHALVTEIEGWIAGQSEGLQ